jgi:sterol desaturase/sphingolipid hydroxylase (fatty acid hydroxylase superfamily)
VWLCIIYPKDIHIDAVVSGTHFALTYVLPCALGLSPDRGQQFHWLHHHYFECNYGSDLVPCDHLFGTYRKDATEIERVKAPAVAAQKARRAVGESKSK